MASKREGYVRAAKETGLTANLANWLLLHYDPSGLPPRPPIFWPHHIQLAQFDYVFVKCKIYTPHVNCDSSLTHGHHHGDIDDGSGIGNEGVCGVGHGAKATHSMAKNGPWKPANEIANIRVTTYSGRQFSACSAILKNIVFFHISK